MRPRGETGLPLDVIAPRFLLSCWVATAEYVEKNPEAIKAFVAGSVVAGGRYTNAHQDETVDMVAHIDKQYEAKAMLSPYVPMTKTG
jgi:ABC-type nitrate/sulfonate/bicarbonate transport system substrate-binding protein